MLYASRANNDCMGHFGVDQCGGAFFPSVDRKRVVGGDRVRAGGSPHGQPGAPREHYFEGMTQLHTVTDEERREWFIKNDNFIID